MEYNMKNFNEIACGGFHSLCLINYSQDLDWIEKDYENICKIIDDVGII